MEKRKNNAAFKIVSLFLMLLVFAVCAVPYISLREGSFVAAALSGLYGLFIHYVGFFASANLQHLTLVPVAVLFVLIAVEAICNLSVIYAFYELVVFEGFYIFAAQIQGNSEYFRMMTVYPAQIVQPLGYVMIFVSLAALIFLSVKEIHNSKKEVAFSGEADEDGLLKVEQLPDFSVKKINPNMTKDEALASLKNTVVPVFRSFPNGSGSGKTVDSSVASNIFAIASLDGNLHRQAMSEIGQEQIADRESTRNLSELFKPRNIIKKQQEEEDVSKLFENLNTDIAFDLSAIPVAETDTAEKKQEPEISSDDKPNDDEVSPVIENFRPAIHQEQGTETYEHSDESHYEDTDEASVDDSDNEESPEEATERYRRMKEESEQNDTDNSGLDFVSAVCGLKSSRNGDYVYDASKYTYKFPPETLLKHYETSSPVESDIYTDADGHTIVDTLAQFKIETQLIGIQHGPTFTLYELALARGIRVNSVLNLADNIAMDLAVQSVRILAPIPGRSAIGIEVPNKKRDTIGFDLMMPALKAKTYKVPMVLGRTITGESVVIDLAGAPHLLIAGTTGSGKSVCVNSLICSILYTKTPREVRMILVDPKMVELSMYNDIPHLLTPVITEPKKAIKVMAFIIEEMERRMTMFSAIGAKKIEDYNTKIKEKQYLRAQLPYIVVVVDEFADLMMVVGKELESYIKRITAVARFTGIHLVLATQRPSADVITGIIKSNIPTQIAFAVSNQLNSRIIIDSTGAEKLLGKGDMLYASASNRVPQRIQGTYIDPEIEDIVNFVKTQGEPDYIDEAYFEDDEEDEDTDDEVQSSSGTEDMYMRAWKLVADKGEASASYIQRKLSIGYNRAANLIEQLEENGCIGPARGSKPREILRYPDSRSEQM